MCNGCNGFNGRNGNGFAAANANGFNGNRNGCRCNGNGNGNGTAAANALFNGNGNGNGCGCGCRGLRNEVRELSEEVNGIAANFNSEPICCFAENPFIGENRVCCDCDGECCGCFKSSSRDCFWPEFSHPTWLCCNDLYSCKCTERECPKYKHPIDAECRFVDGICGDDDCDCKGKKGGMKRR